MTDLMTNSETISYLRLDAEPGDPVERLRNLIRRQQLPVLKRGRLQRFRRDELDAWLRGERITRKMSHPARLVGTQRLTTKGA